MTTTIPPCSSPRIQAAKHRLAAQTCAIAVVAAAALTPTAEAVAAETVFTPVTPHSVALYGYLLVDPYSLFTTTDFNNPGSALLFLDGSSLNVSDGPGGPIVEFVSLFTTNFSGTDYNLRTSLPAGTVIDATSPLANSNGTVSFNGDFISAYSGSDYADIVIGYRIPNVNTPGGLDFGWIRYSYEYDTRTTSITEWAIRTDGQGIVVPSAIPEPSAFAAITGVALLGFAATRRRRRAG